MSRPRKHRRVARILVRLLLAGLAACCAALLGVLFWLSTQHGRETARRLAVEAANEQILGTLELAEVTELGLGRVRVRGVELRDPAGARVLSVGEVELRPDLWALARGDLRVASVVLERPSLHLHERGGMLGIAAALGPREADHEDGPGEPTPFAVGAIRVLDGSLEALPSGLRLAELGLVASVRFDGALRLQVTSLDAVLRRSEVELARIAATSADLDLSGGQRSTVRATVRNAESRVDLRASLQLTDEGIGDVEAHAELDLEPTLLAAFGSPGFAGVLRSGLQGEVELTGAPEDLIASAELRSNGGSLRLDAHHNRAQTVLRAASSGLDLSRIISGVDGIAAGRLRVVRSAAGTGPGEHRLRVHAEELRFSEWALPALEVAAVLAPDHVRIEHVALPNLTDPGGRLACEGRVDFDGGADIRLAARLPNIAQDPNVRRLLPGARASVETQLRLQMRGGDAPEITADGYLAVTDAVGPEVRVGRLEARGTVRGSLVAPRLDLQVDGAALHVGGQRIDSLSLGLRGGPARYSIGGQVLLPRGRRLQLDVEGRLDGARYRLDGQLVAGGVLPAPLTARLSGIVIDPERSVEIGRLAIHGGGVEAEVHGRYRFRGASQLEIAAREVDLRSLDALLGQDLELSGRASLAATVRGTAAHPNVTASLTIEDGEARGVRVRHLALDGSFLDGERQATLELDVDLADAGRLELRGEARLGSGRDPMTALGASTFDVRVDASALSPALLAPFVESPGLAGRVDLKAHLWGEPTDPRLELEARGRDVSVAGASGLAGGLAARAEGEQITVSLHAEDAEGSLFDGRGEVALGLATVARATDPAALLRAPFRLHATLPERDLSSLPGATALDVPARVRATAEVAGGDQPLQADLRVELSLDRAALDDGCGAVEALHSIVEVALRDGESTLRAQVQSAGRTAAELDLTAPTPFATWLAPGADPAVPPVSGQLELRSTDLSRIPFACARAQGAVGGVLDLRDVFGRRPSMTLRGRGEGLVFGPHPPYDLELNGALDHRRAELTGRLHAGEHEAARIQLRAPVEWDEGILLPVFDREHWQGRVRLEDAPVAALLGALPTVRRPSGTVTGGLEVRADPGQLRARGAIVLRGVGLTLTAPVQRFEDVNGRVTLSNEALVLDAVRINDRGGSLTASGRLSLSNWTPRRVAVEVVADDFPTRVEGIVFATLDGRASISGDLGDDRRDLVVTLRQVAIRLPETAGGRIQSLRQHPEVIYEDQPGFDPDPAAVGAEAAQPGPGPGAVIDVPTTVRVDATAPFWVSHPDFAVQVATELTVASEGARVRVAGPVQIRRGFLTLLGKTFQIKASTLRLDGGLRADPLLDLSASHTLGSGHHVFVHVGGRVSQPDLTFSSDDPAAQTDADVIALLTGGLRGPGGDRAGEAEQQATSMVSSLTAGLVGTLARRELGEWVPMMAIETQGTVESSRIRAGIRADRVIPEAWQGVVQGAYVEGALAGDEGGGAAARAGFLIELLFPHALSTSASYEQPDNWSLDLLWEP